MQKRRLATTDIEVSVLGLGTVKLGRKEGVKYPHDFQIPSDKEADILLNTAKELGINLLDTAPAYGNSEERLGKLLKNTRQEWVISTKVGESFINGHSYFDFSKKAIQQSIEQSLMHLKTDYLDMVLVHSNGEDEFLINEMNVFDTLSQLKKAGKMRLFGMSSKTLAGGLLTLTHADIAMITYHPAYRDEHEIITKAYQLKKSILIKKPLASGHLNTFNTENPVQDALQFILKEPGVTSIIVGTINPEHLRENAKACAD